VVAILRGKEEGRRCARGRGRASVGRSPRIASPQSVGWSVADDCEPTEGPDFVRFGITLGLFRPRLRRPGCRKPRLYAAASNPPRPAAPVPCGCLCNLQFQPFTSGGRHRPSE
jgi:hypothetical protein